jgi:alpha/beta superfamily hydrolase
MINGAEDRVVAPDSVKSLVDKLKTQKGIVISHEVIPGANHFFEDRMDELLGAVNGYLDRRLDPSYRLPSPGKSKAKE